MLHFRVVCTTPTSSQTIFQEKNSKPRTTEGAALLTLQQTHTWFVLRLREMKHRKVAGGSSESHAMQSANRSSEFLTDIRTPTKGLKFVKFGSHLMALGSANPVLRWPSKVRQQESKYDQHLTSSLQQPRCQINRTQAIDPPAKNDLQGQAVDKIAIKSVTSHWFPNDASLGTVPRPVSSANRILFDGAVNNASQPQYEAKQDLISAQSPLKAPLKSPQRTPRAQYQPATSPPSRPMTSPVARPSYGYLPAVATPPTPFCAQFTSYSTNPLPCNMMHPYPTGAIDHYVLQKTLIPSLGSLYKAFAVMNRVPAYDFIEAMSGWT